MERLGLKVSINGTTKIVAYGDDIDSVGASLSACTFRTKASQTYESSITVGGWKAGTNKEVYWTRNLPAPIGSTMSFEVIDSGQPTQLESNSGIFNETDFKFDSPEEYMLVTIDLNGTTIGTLGGPEVGPLFVRFFASDNKENVPDSTELGKMVLTAGQSLPHPDAANEKICDDLQLSIGDIVTVKYHGTVSG